MKVLLFITSFRQVREFDHFRRFLQRLATLGGICDLFIYCNNAEISADIVTYYKAFTQKNKHLYITTRNAGFVMGAVEAVSNGMEMGLFKGYDYVIHLHPDVYITDDAGILEVLRANATNDDVFLVNRSMPGDQRFFSFDFFIFKPRLLNRNIFIDELDSYKDCPEHYLCDMLTKHDVRFRIIERFNDDNWFPRRIDDHLSLFHEHDWNRVEELLRTSTTKDAHEETSSDAEVAKWQSPLVELRPPTPIKR